MYDDYVFGRDRRRSMKVALGIVTVIVAMGAGIAGCKAWYLPIGAATFTVKEKAPSTDEKPFRIFTNEGEVFGVGDSMWAWRFNSSDLYGQLEVGKRYHCTTLGRRIPFLSSWRNLMKCEELKA